MKTKRRYGWKYHSMNKNLSQAHFRLLMTFLYGYAFVSITIFLITLWFVWQQSHQTYDIPTVTVPIGIDEHTVGRLPQPESVIVVDVVGRGQASYYGAALHGRTTASGEKFDMHALTAAHPSLPFGTQLKVVNQSTGQSVDVVVNDRGPYVDGRVIDLSQAAFNQIASLSQGVVDVVIEKEL